MGARALLPLLWVAAICITGAAPTYDSQGPSFSQEPQARVDLTNEGGARVDCAGRGNPAPRVEWRQLLGGEAGGGGAGLGVPVRTVPGVRHLLDNGSLVFPPFQAAAFRQDIHWGVYRCILSNSVGIIVSRDVTVRAVVNQHYEPEVQSPTGFLGNNVIIRCVVPPFVKDYVAVTSWLQEPAFNIYPSPVSHGKYHMLPSGELLVLNISASDARHAFRCRTHHRLSQRNAASSNTGRIQVTEARGPVAPILHETSAVVRARVEDSVVVPCVAHAIPPPTYSWWRHDNSVEAERPERFTVQDGSLSFASVKESDAGVYLCNASNSVGSEVLELTLSVWAPLSVHVVPPRQTVDVGKSADLHCQAAGFPRTHVLWLKDGRPMRGLGVSLSSEDAGEGVTGASTARVRLLAADRLHVASVTKEDKGMYQCLVRNDHDMALGAAELRLGDAAPTLQYKFIEQTMQPGPSVSLKCSASGNPTPHMSWKLDGFPLPPNDRMMIGQYVTVYGDVVSHVNMTGVKAEDGGEYECEAENRAGVAKHQARLNIYGPPFVRPMPEIIAVAGKTLHIKCPVAGYPIENVIWEKDGVRLPSNMRQRVSSNTISIDNVQHGSDQGAYSCTARAKHSHAAKRVVNVRVLVPPRISPFYFEEGLTEGMRTQVMCTISQGDPPVSIRWVRDSEPIQASDGIQIKDFAAFSSVLTIDSVTSNHSGNYTCVVTNSAGRVDYTAALSVTVPPRWVLEPTDQSVVTGNSVTLQCQADGFPKPNVTWKQAVGSQPEEYRDVGLEFQQLDGGSLFLAEAGPQHRGYFLCQASNGIGPALSKLVRLNVLVGPRIRVHPRTETARRGEGVTLRCAADGDPPLDLTWRLRGSRIDPAFDARHVVKNNPVNGGVLSELSIAETDLRDRGEYQCVASNAYGQDSVGIQLLVQEPPDFPRNLHVSEQTGRSVTLSWSPSPTSADSTVDSYIVQYKEARDVWHEHNQQKVLEAGETSTLIGGLKPATAYHFRIYARNQLGTSAPSDVLHAVTDSEVPAGPPLQVSVDPASSTQLRVTWQPPDRTLWNGDILGYIIGFRHLGSTEEFNYTRVSMTGNASGDYILSGLDKYTQYQVVVQAFNTRGEGPQSPVVTEQTMEDVPSGPPRDVQCSALSAHNLQVGWTAPSQHLAHGIIQGYRLFYEATDDDALADTATRESKAMTSTSTVLHGLVPASNYTLQVLAFTRAGDGASSEPIVCTTDEAVPDPPERIKAVVKAVDAVVLSWTPPRRSNGRLIKYTVHVRQVVMGDRSSTPVVKGTVPSSQLHFDVVDLVKEHTYEAWVTASTKVGSGRQSRTVPLTPSSTVPAAVVSWGRSLVLPWRTNVTLRCLAVGVPSPSLEWRHGDVRLDVSSGQLMLANLQRFAEGNYSCHVSNSLGSDVIVYSLQVQVPPTAPLLLATTTTVDSVQLQWKQGDNGGAPVRGFVLAFRRELGEWEEVSLDRRASTHLQTGLMCGTRYQFTLTAFNKIGSGASSDVKAATTKGGKPSPAPQTQFLQVNASAATLHLPSWKDNDCPILYFVVEYRRDNDEWELVSNNASPSERLAIAPLMPRARFAVRVAAHNNAGSTVQLYNFTTPLLAGNEDSMSADSAVVDAGYESTPFYMDAAVLAPIIISIIAIVGALGLAWFCLRRKPGLDELGIETRSAAMVALDNKQNLNMEQRDQYYVTTRKALQSPCRDINALERIPEYSEDIYPYATFHLPEHENMGGNPQRRGTFLGYHDPLAALDMLDQDHYQHIRSSGGPGVTGAGPGAGAGGARHGGRSRSRSRHSRAKRSDSDETDSAMSDSDTERGASSRTESSNHVEHDEHSALQGSLRHPPRHRGNAGGGSGSGGKDGRSSSSSSSGHHSQGGHRRSAHLHRAAAAVPSPQHSYLYHAQKLSAAAEPSQTAERLTLPSRGHRHRRRDFNVGVDTMSGAECDLESMQQTLRLGDHPRALPAHVHIFGSRGGTAERFLD